MSEEEWHEAVAPNGTPYYYTDGGKTSWVAPNAKQKESVPKSEEAASAESAAQEANGSEQKQAGTATKISPQIEKLVDQLYESTWNNKALKYIGTGSEEVVAITKALRDNFSVTAVYDMRGDGGIDDDACRHLSNALRVNDTVTKLSISSTSITDEGIKAIASLLQDGGCKICRLSLWFGDHVGDQGAQCLANALKHNFSVREVYVQGPGFSEVGADFLAGAMRINELIDRISVVGAGIGVNG